MGAHLLQPPVTLWDCERCPCEDRTQVAGPHTRFHSCAALGGAQVPMRIRGSGARVILREREDYIGAERVQLMQIDGQARPVMAAVTEHPDGRQDAAVYAPTASASADARH